MGAKLGGAGGGKFAIGQNADINVTPFVDIMLVLLIIFMVSAPLATVAIKVDVPPPSPNAAPEDPKEPVLVNVEMDGVYIGADQVTLDELPTKLADALAVANPHDERISIRANRLVPYSKFMEVLNKLQFDGYMKIGLIAEDL